MEDEIALLPSVHEQEIRNVGAWGNNGEEKQDLLYSSRVMVVGSDALAQMVSANLIGLGVGNICCIDDKTISPSDKYNFLYSKNKGRKSFLGEKRVQRITSTLQAINPLLTIVYYESTFKRKLVEEFNPEIVVDATNEPKLKNDCLEYCIQKSIPFISVVSDQKRSELSIFNPNGNEEWIDGIVDHKFSTQQQGSYTSGVIAGLAAEQIRKLKFSIDDSDIDKPLKTGQHISYNPHPIINEQPLFRDLSVLIVGAGAIGNFVALNLALLGVGNIDIIDGDIIEYHNLNRQLLLYGKPRDFKAKVLSERIKEINSSVDGEFYNFYLTEETPFMDYLGIKRYDAIFGCVDNYKARYLINKLAVKHKIPYIDGGTSASGGGVAVYIPYRNRCIDCQSNLKQYVIEGPIKKEGCVNDPDPSIIIPNIITGSAMVAEFVNIVSGTPQLLEKIFKYDTYSKNRIYLQPMQVISKCGFGCS